MARVRRTRTMSKRTVGENGRVTVAGKARNGAGSVYLDRATGRWVGRAVIGKDDATGKPIRRTVYGKSQAEAQARLIELQGNAQAGTVSMAKGRVPTLADYAAAWLVSRDGYRTERTTARCRNFLRPALEELGGVQLSKLEREHVNRLLGRLLREGTAPSTVAGVRATLRACLNAAIKDGKIASRRNAAAEADPPKVRREEMHPLTTAQIRALLAAATAPPEALSAYEAHEGPLFAFLAVSGLRVSEALGLTWADVDRDAQTYTVRRQLKRGLAKGHSDFRLELLKTDASHRIIEATAPELVMLDAQRERQQRECGECPAWGNDWGLVFTNLCGAPLDQNSVNRKWHAWRAALGFNGGRVRLHDLRHTCATYLLGKRTPILEVSRRLGHSNVSITLNTYGHSTREGRDIMGAALAELLSE